MLNIDIFNLINSLAGKSLLLDSLMIFVAEYLIFIIIIPLVYLFVKDKKNFVFAFLCSLVSLIIGQLIKFFFYFPRPFALGIGKQLIEHAADSSYPSDHTIAVLSLGFGLMLTKYKKTGILFLILGLLIGFSRIFVGVHFPVDILGSVLVSFIGCIIVYLFFRRI